MRFVFLMLTVMLVPQIALTAAEDQSDADQPADEQSTAQTVAYSDAGADTCLRCHDEDSEFPVLDIFRTAHAISTDKRTPFAQQQCESCHGPGGAHTGRVRRGQERPGMIKFGSNKDTPVAQQNEMCMGCHRTQLDSDWHGGNHDAAGLACADCHSIHAVADPMFSPVLQPQTCFGCHRSQKADSQRFSSHPIRFGKMACTACHQPHGSTADHDLKRDSINDTCYQCHAEKRGPFLWEHAPVAEDCSLCHQSHGSNHPALLTRRAPLLCQQCHSQADHPSIARSPAGVPAQAGTSFLSAGSCVNCHAAVHGSNHPSGAGLRR